MVGAITAFWLDCGSWTIRPMSRYMHLALGSSQEYRYLRKAKHDTHTPI